MLSILTRAVGRVLESIDFKIHESSDLRAGSLFLNDRYDDDGSVWLWIPACCYTMGSKKNKVAFAFSKNCAINVQPTIDMTQVSQKICQITFLSSIHAPKENMLHIVIWHPSREI